MDFKPLVTYGLVFKANCLKKTTQVKILMVFTATTVKVKRFKPSFYTYPHSQRTQQHKRSAFNVEKQETFQNRKLSKTSFISTSTAILPRSERSTSKELPKETNTRHHLGTTEQS